MAETSALRAALVRAIDGQAGALAGFSQAEVMHEAMEQGVVGLLPAKDGDNRLNRSVQDWKKDQAAQDLLQRRAADRFTRLLQAHGLPCLLLKGLPLACLLYPAPWQRPRCDVDVYVPESSLEPLARLLRGEEYTVHGLGRRRASSRQFQASQGAAPHARVVFDIHWRLSNRVMFRDALSFEACRARRQAVPLIGPDAHALGDADLLLHACLHRIGHGRNTARDRLVWLYDIHLLAGVMDEDAIAAFTQGALEKQVGGVCADGLQAAAGLFGTRLPDALLAELRSRLDREPSSKLLRAPRWRWALADVAGADGLSGKLAYARELAANQLPAPGEARGRTRLFYRARRMAGRWIDQPAALATRRIRGGGLNVPWPGQARFSLLTVNYFTTHYLKLLLLTLSEQHDLQRLDSVVICDNGSKDGGAAFARKLARATTRILLVERKWRTDHAPGMRAAIRAVDERDAQREPSEIATVFLHCDTDVIFLRPDTLAELAKVFEAGGAAFAGELRHGLFPLPEAQASFLAVRRDWAARSDISPWVTHGQPAWWQQRDILKRGGKGIDFRSNRDGFALHRGRAGVAAAGEYQPFSAHGGAADDRPHYMGVPGGARTWAERETAFSEWLGRDAEPELIRLLAERLSSQT